MSFENFAGSALAADDSHRWVMHRSPASSVPAILGLQVGSFVFGQVDEVLGLDVFASSDWACFRSAFGRLHSLPPGARASGLIQARASFIHRLEPHDLTRQPEREDAARAGGSLWDDLHGMRLLTGLIARLSAHLATMEDLGAWQIDALVERTVVHRTLPLAREAALEAPPEGSLFSFLMLAEREHGVGGQTVLTDPHRGLPSMHWTLKEPGACIAWRPDALHMHTLPMLPLFDDMPALRDVLRLDFRRLPA